MANNVGRNDPCPCGSGAKYKHCCLHNDQNETGASSEFEMGFSSTSSSRTLSPVEEVWETFENADYEERQALLEDTIGDPERMDGENAFHMFNELCPAAVERGDAEWLFQSITRLEQEQPEVYASERPYLLSYLLTAAAITGEVEPVAANRVDDLATVASQDIDEFHPTIETIAYHSPLAPIAQAMQEGWPEVREDPNIMPFGKNDFANQGLQYALLASYEENGTVDLQTPELQDRIEVYDATEEGEVDFEYLERFAERLSGSNTQPWQVEDDPAENIHWLTVDFMCTVYEDTNLPLGRIHLARRNLSSCYASRYDDGVYGVEPDLQLSRSEIEQQFESIGNFVSSRPHQRGAFFCLLPAWVAFLEERELISEKAVASMRRTLHGLQGNVSRTLENFSSDPSLPADVQATLD